MAHRVRDLARGSQLQVAGIAATVCFVISALWRTRVGAEGACGRLCGWSLPGERHRQ